MSNLNGELIITIHEARNLKDVQMIGKQDPFVKVWIEDDAQKTRVAKDGNTNPVWGQSFIFYLHLNRKDQEIVHFSVRNRNLTFDDVIGRADIKVRDLLHDGLRGVEESRSPAGKQLEEKIKGLKKAIQLVDPDNFTHIRGYLDVTAEFRGAGFGPSSPSSPSSGFAPPSFNPALSPDGSFGPARANIPSPMSGNVVVQPTAPFEQPLYPQVGPPIEQQCFQQGPPQQCQQQCQQQYRPRPSGQYPGNY